MQPHQVNDSRARSEGFKVLCNQVHAILDWNTQKNQKLRGMEADESKDMFQLQRYSGGLFWKREHLLGRKLVQINRTEEKWTNRRRMRTRTQDTHSVYGLEGGGQIVQGGPFIADSLMVLLLWVPLLLFGVRCCCRALSLDGVVDNEPILLP